MTDGTPLELGKRQRQIYEAVLKIGEGSVSDILAELNSPPSYSAVRAMLGILVEKGYLKIREEGRKYVYHASLSKQKTQKTALRRMLDTFLVVHRPPRWRPCWNSNPMGFLRQKRKSFANSSMTPNARRMDHECFCRCMAESVVTVC